MNIPTSSIENSIIDGDASGGFILKDMSPGINQLQQQWNRFCLRIWIIGFLKAFALSGTILAVLNFFWNAVFFQPVFWVQIVSLLFLCEEWGRIHAVRDRCLAILYLRQPRLAEALHYGLELQNSRAASPVSAYFRDRHLESLRQHLQKETLAENLPLKLPLFLAAGAAVSLGLVLWGLPALTQNLWAGMQEESRTLQERKFRILYPAYMRKKALFLNRLPNPFTLPRGSRMEIYFMQSVISESSRKRFLFETSHGRNPLHWLHQDNRWIATLSPLVSGTLLMNWQGAASRHEIEVIPDRPPQLRVSWPQNQPIFSNSSLSITLSASDDHGLQQIILNYEQEENEGRREIIQSFEGQFTEYQEIYPWELGTTFLRAGDRVTAWIEATDNDALYGPNLAVSEKFVFTVQNMKTYHQNIMERLQQIVAELGQLMSLLDRKMLKETFEKEQKILNELKSLRENADYDRMLSSELRQFLFFELQEKIQFFQKQRMQLSPPPNLILPK
ncbi:MAG: hypothetical protein HQM13_22260 [SAR324 cluster bacterium]|nr:hypothetical protein [SAR324 cluster bacterium]